MAQTHGSLLITAGPTHEPIDRVRFIGNRSSGRLGIALAAAAAEKGLRVTLLLGPTGAAPAAIGPADTPVRVKRFQTAADLQGLLREELPGHDVLIQAAAVADYRPKTAPAGGRWGGAADRNAGEQKIRRGDQPLTLELEPTPDLLAECSQSAAGAGKTLIGFALEPRDRLRASALSKLERKAVHAIIANPLETMDAPTIEAEVFWRGGGSDKTAGAIAKEEFARWFIGLLEARGVWSGTGSAR